MRTVFLGTSAFAVPSLKAIASITRAVISRPDRPAGRGRKLRKPPVAEEALSLGLDLYQPEKLSEVREVIERIAPEVMVSASYGAWLPKWLLNAAPLGVVNVHPSLLPRHRGAAPVIRTILEGDETTGVSFMVTDQGWDTGDILRTVEVPLENRLTAGELEAFLAGLAAEELPGVLRGYEAGELVPYPQSGCESYAEKVTPEESVIDWNLPVEEVHRAVRAFNPVPGARTLFRGTILKVHSGRILAREGPTGTILGEDPLVVACGEGSLVILELQPQGKRRMTGGEFSRGYRPDRGEKLG